MQQVNVNDKPAFFSPICIGKSHNSETNRNRNQWLILFTAIALLMTFFSNAQTTASTEDFKKELKNLSDMKSMFGIKAGYNVARLTGSTPEYRPDSKNGFMVAVCYSPTPRKGFGYRSEIVFSRQGFGFDETGKQTSVVSDYLYMPQFTTFNITKFAQLQVGGQIGYLLKSSKEQSEAPSEDITSWANRLDYGAAFGVEIYPVKNLIIGGRYNMSMGKAYKQLSTTPSPIPNPLPFNPSDVKSKNAVINFFVGIRF